LGCQLLPDCHRPFSLFSPPLPLPPSPSPHTRS
jgi:hypothetical protein